MSKYSRKQLIMKQIMLSLSILGMAFKWQFLLMVMLGCLWAENLIYLAEKLKEQNEK